MTQKQALEIMKTGVNVFLCGNAGSGKTFVLKEYIKGFTFVPGPLQRIIPMDPNNGVYMIAYNDNNNAIALKNNLQNTQKV